MDYPLHLGVTEAGDAEDGRIKSALGIGALLHDGIGDTVRVSSANRPRTKFLWRLCYVTLSLQGAPIPYRRPVSGRCPAYRLIIPQSHVRRILSAISFRWRLMRTAR